MEPPTPHDPDEEPTPEIPPPLRVPEEYPGGTPAPDPRRTEPEPPDRPDEPWF